MVVVIGGGDSCGKENQLISNNTVFAKILSGVMQWNKENGTDFPVALAQDMLDGTNLALDVLALGVKKLDKPLFGFKFLLPSAE